MVARRPYARVSYRHLALMALSLLGVLAAWSVGDLGNARKRAERDAQDARAAEARAQSLNQEAAEVDRFEATRQWQNGDGPAALAHLVRAIHYAPQSSLAAEQAISTLNAWKNPPQLVRDCEGGFRATDVQIASDSAHFCTVAFDSRVGLPYPHMVRIWETATGRLTAALEGWDGRFSPDGRRIVTVNENVAAIYDVTGQRLATLEGHSNRVLEAVFSPDGTLIVSVSADLTARIWDAAAGKLHATIEFGEASVGRRHAEFSPNGANVLTVAGKVQIWDATTGKLLLTLVDPESKVMSARYSPDSARIVTVGGKTAKVWDAISGKLLVTLSGDDESIRSAEFSPDGRRIVTGSDELRVWDVATGKRLLTCGGPRSRFSDHLVLSAEFSPDGSRLLSVAEKYPASVWEASTGRLVADLRSDITGGDGKGGACYAHFSRDGHQIVTVSIEGIAQLWATWPEDSPPPPPPPMNSGPPPEWLPDFLNYMGKMRLDAKGREEKIRDDDELAALRSRLRAVLTAEANHRSPYLDALRYYLENERKEQ